MSELQFPVIITFGNQKGGVGKTTLCICLANYLVSKGVKVSVIDCDAQQSIVRWRRRDIKSNPEAVIPYEVTGVREPTVDNMFKIIKDIYSNHTDEVILFDCPGCINEDWMPRIIENSDIVVIPFHYDSATIMSTSAYLLYVDGISKSRKRQEGIKIFMISNMHEKRVGTKKELELWEMARKTYSGFGIVTPHIDKRSTMPRVSTIDVSTTPMPNVENAFTLIYDLINSN